VFRRSTATAGVSPHSRSLPQWGLRRAMSRPARRLRGRVARGGRGDRLTDLRCARPSRKSTVLPLRRADPKTCVLLPDGERIGDACPSVTRASPLPLAAFRTAALKTVSYAMPRGAARPGADVARSTRREPAHHRDAAQGSGARTGSAGRSPRPVQSSRAGRPRPGAAAGHHPRRRRRGGSARSRGLGALGRRVTYPVFPVRLSAFRPDEADCWPPVSGRRAPIPSSKGWRTRARRPVLPRTASAARLAMLAARPRLCGSSTRCRSRHGAR